MDPPAPSGPCPRSHSPPSHLTVAGSRLMSCSSAREARVRRLAVAEAVGHEGEGEVEPVVAFAAGELGGVAGEVGEGFGGQGGEPA
jgi:hypothetical protein